jgi:hypothetical protein
MSLEKIVAEALANRPLEMKHAFQEEIQARIQARLEAEYMDESFDLSVEDLEDFIASDEFDSLDEETQNTIMYYYEGSIKGSGTDRKAQLKKAYRAGEQKTRDFYKSKITSAPKTGDSGVKKAFDSGAKAGDGSSTPTGAKRSKSQDSLSGTEHDRSKITPTSKSFRSTHQTKSYAIAKSKRGKLPG